MLSSAGVGVTRQTPPNKPAGERSDATSLRGNRQAIRAGVLPRAKGLFPQRICGHLFPAYGMQVPDLYLGMRPAKVTFFCTCLSSLSLEQQRQLLYDLCESPPLAEHAVPSKQDRLRLLRELAQADGISPLGVHLSSLTAHATRQQWFTAASRLPNSPASAVTAARALVETTCKTVLTERGRDPDESGKLDRLFKRTTQELGIKATDGAGQAVYQLIHRTGTSRERPCRCEQPSRRSARACGQRKNTDHSLASLAVHAAGTVSLFIVQVHRVGMRTEVVA